MPEQHATWSMSFAGGQTGAATVMVAERAAAMIMGQTVPKPDEPARFPEPVAA